MTLWQSVRAVFSAGIRATYQNWDDFWFNPVWGQSSTASGVPVGPDAMLKVSAMTAGVRVIAETLGMLPLKLYEKRENGSRVEAEDDPLYALLHDQPNPWQTAQQFVEMLTAWAILWGEGIAEIKPGRRRVVGELWPIHPDHVQQVNQTSSGRLVYTVRATGDDGRATGETRYLTQDDLFRVSGIGVHRFIPLRLLYLARESVGLWLAMERHGSKFFAQGATPSLLIETEKILGSTGRQKFKEAILAALAGKSQHGTLVLDEGAKAKVLGSTASDAQLVEEREFQVREFARWLRIPEHMLAVSDEPTHASSEVYALDLIKYSFGPWFKRWESSVQRDLITIPGQYAEFLPDALLRGTTLERYQAYAQALAENNGPRFLDVNEVRRKENLPPWPGQTGPPAPKSVEPASARPQPAPDRASALLQAGARQATRREVEAVRHEATPRRLADVDRWRAWVDQFYARHAAFLSEMLVVPLERAQAFCWTHRAELLSDGLDVLARWERDTPGDLVRLASTNGHAAVEV